MMQKLKNYFSQRGVGYYLTIPAVVCLFLAYRLYCRHGITQFQPALSQTVIVCCLMAAGLGAVTLVFDCKYVRFVAYLVALYGFIMFIDSQVTYIVNVLVSIDGNSFSGGFISTAATLLLGTILLIISGCLTKWHPWKKKEA